MKQLIPALLLGLLSGCATPKTLKTENYPTVAGTSIPERNLERVRAPEVVKSYPTGRYTDPNFPDAMHERHTLYRKEQSANWNYRPGGPYAYPLVLSDPTPSYYVTTDGDQRNAQQKAYAAALEEQNVAMKKRIESLQQEAGKVPALQQQVDKLKEQLEAEPLETPAPKNQHAEEKPTGFTLKRPQPDCVDERALNGGSSGELDTMEERLHLAFMDKNFLKTIAP